MADNAKLIIEGTTYELPTLIGTEGEKAVDIRKLRGASGYVTLDSGYMNTGSCESAITFINGEEGILRYRGIPIEQLTEKSSFAEVSKLVLDGELPKSDVLDEFSRVLTENAMIPEELKNSLYNFPADAHPMSVLGSLIFGLAGFYPHVDATSSEDEIRTAATNLIAKTSTIAAFSYKRSIGEPFVYPSKDLGYSENFLNMMFSSPVNGYEIDSDMVEALEKLLILHVDHEQNCSASTMRLVGSSHANLYSAVAASIAALWGPLHGGANQSVMEMLATIHQSGKDPADFIEMAKDKSNSFRLAGFGHRVYKNYDPRARVIKGTCRKVLEKSAKDPLLQIAMQLEEQVLQDDYFIQRKLYPNVDFYSGILYKAMGIPTEMFTVLFAIGRMPGWISQWKEMISDPTNKIGRPRQIYNGNNKTDYTPVENR